MFELTMLKSKSMGLIYASIDLSNPRKSNNSNLSVQALADSGSQYLCIPRELAERLELDELEKRVVYLASGERTLCSYVGPIQVRYSNRNCFTGALVLGNQVLLGAIPMEDMDLVLVPNERKLILNPMNLI